MKEDDDFWELCAQCTNFKPVGWDCSCEFPPTEQDLAADLTGQLREQFRGARPLDSDLVAVINAVIKEQSQWGKKGDSE
tara:strand:+ start:4455 stop:4691 length:237 start_codon:yes stop_codon:yes gene_type:complete